MVLFLGGSNSAQVVSDRKSKIWVESVPKVDYEARSSGWVLRTLREDRRWLGGSSVGERTRRVLQSKEEVGLVIWISLFLHCG